jgi:hypothetical protein
VEKGLSPNHLQVGTRALNTRHPGLKELPRVKEKYLYSEQFTADTTCVRFSPPSNSTHLSRHQPGPTIQLNPILSGVSTYLTSKSSGPQGFPHFRQHCRHWAWKVPRFLSNLATKRGYHNSSSGSIICSKAHRTQRNTNSHF